MTVEKKRAFIINFIYVLVIACLVYFAVKYAINWIMPFVIAFLIAALLHPVIKFFTRKLKLKTQKPTAIVVTALFYCTFGVLISLILINTVTAVLGFIQKVPEYYQNDIAPSLNALFDNITQKLASLNVEIDLSPLACASPPVAIARAQHQAWNKFKARCCRTDKHRY